MLDELHDQVATEIRRALSVWAVWRVALGRPATALLPARVAQ